MNHLDFVLWMVLFPVSIEINSYIVSRYSKPKEPSGSYGLFIIIVWFFVGYQLF